MHKVWIGLAFFAIVTTVTWSLGTGIGTLMNWPGVLAPHQFAAFLILIAFFGPGLTMLNRWAKRRTERKALRDAGAAPA